jgi:hypothetical protein
MSPTFSVNILDIDVMLGADMTIREGHPISPRRLEKV